MRFPYNEKVLEHFKNPRNVGKIENPDGKAMVGSPACGDMVAVYLKVDDSTHRIEDIKFESYGCASNIATGSIITELAKGKTIEEAKEISWQQASDALGGLPKIKVHCSVLAIEGLREAITNYEEKHGLIKERAPTTVEVVTKRLKSVMNPLSGLDIVRTNLLKDVQVKDGIVTIAIDLPENHIFAANIRDDIKEKIETLWDVKEVRLTFSESV
jgi:nitrogen fixation NifU-like protein